MSVGGGSGGVEPPLVEVTEYDQIIVDDTANPSPLFGTGVRTNAILVRADPDNTDTIFLGFDTDVDSNSGLELQAGDNFSMRLNVSRQNVFAIPNSGSQVAMIVGAQ